MLFGAQVLFKLLLGRHSVVLFGAIVPKFYFAVWFDRTDVLFRPAFARQLLNVALSKIVALFYYLTRLSNSRR